MNIALAVSDSDVTRCYPVVAQLRPHLTKDHYLQQVGRQRKEGYRLAYLEGNGAVHSVAGFRIMEMLAFGKILYVDDLVSTDGQRSKGYGGKLFDWLVEHAKANSCAQLHLDSGVHRFAAHRFYLTKRMEITSHHFALKFNP